MVLFRAWISCKTQNKIFAFLYIWRSAFILYFLGTIGFFVNLLYEIPCDKLLLPCSCLRRKQMKSERSWKDLFCFRVRRGKKPRYHHRNNTDRASYFPFEAQMGIFFHFLTTISRIRTRKGRRENWDLRMPSFPQKKIEGSLTLTDGCTQMKGSLHFLLLFLSISKTPGE